MTNTIQTSIIFRNTIFLYFRMFITIAVGLYTSRVVLDVLGVSDFGIYNVVGGIVTMLSFLNVGMNQASARFISFALGKNDEENLKTVFGTCIVTHLTISVIVLVLAECVGVWFLNTRLNIPPDRLIAANWVFQFSILTFMFAINTVPYSSCIISHEHMNVYAYTSISDVILKLCIVLALYYVECDKLIIYAAFYTIITVLNTGIYFIYARCHFKETIGKIRYSWSSYKEMFSFACWGMIGNMGFSCKDQGSNIILNLFFGTLVNGARGVASQVNGIINGFASSFTMALNPQIIKLYANGNKAESKRLVMSGARLAFYLMSFITIPFIINADYILGLWLVEVPEYTTVFVTIILSASLLYSLSHTLSTAIAATGHFKWFQIFLALTLLSELPIAYIILKNGGEPYYALLPYPVTCFVSLILRIVIMHHYEPSYSYLEYIVGVIARCLFVFLISLALSYYVRSILPDDSFFSLVISTIVSFVVIGLFAFFLGITIAERQFVIQKIGELLNKN